jgi:hypothetical protein
LAGSHYGCSPIAKYWYHIGCGGKTYVRYEALTIFCIRCDKEFDIFDWKFACDKHRPEQPTPMGMIQAFSSMCMQDGDNRKAIGTMMAKLSIRMRS